MEDRKCYIKESLENTVMLKNLSFKEEYFEGFNVWPTKHISYILDLSKYVLSSKQVTDLQDDDIQERLKTDLIRDDLCFDIKDGVINPTPPATERDSEDFAEEIKSHEFTTADHLKNFLKFV